MNLTQKYLKTVLCYDQNSGDFTWKGKRSGVKSGSVAGTLKTSGYIQIKLLKKYHYAHRLAWLYFYGVMPSGDIDHIDGVKNNNKISNLRDVSKSTNMGNIKKASSRNSSGMLGAYLDKRRGRWFSQITADGKRFCLGCFEDPFSANRAYIEAKRKLHPGCTI